ncbi:LuxR family transcriptional regulator [Nocardia sp. NRRL S-836]|uniref:helix-turn-helix transcriptional regulator n=1 Tax=Nocardia sp. NRRL S-836 TaxID=1519492 RepID=UPI0006ADE968|nr:LuxR family transcriptional regulator [Nocardia sp. NRRL S-836]KOV79148.1 hypothetical protein ADL03_38560 [Nocardia sp. NRRL S-836]
MRTLASPGRTFPGAPGTGWPFAGRRQDLADVLSALTGPGAALVGPAGVGKTRLAAEVAQRLEGSGVTVWWCRATVAASGVPFGAMAAVLPADMRTANPLGRAVEHLLAQPAPLAIVVDDAHLLDDASIGLLHNVIRHGHARVLITARPGGRAELWQEGLLRRCPVGELSRAESDELLERLLGGPVDNRSARMLWAGSAGNPLYLGELVLSGHAAGVLRAHDGSWSWHGPIELGGRLAELVRADLGDLEPVDLHALELLAHCEPVELDLPASLVRDETLDDLETRGLIRFTSSGNRTVVRLGHPLHGRFFRATCPPLRAQSHQRALAASLEAMGARRRDDLMRIAAWRLGGGAPLSLDLLTTAAEQAWAVRDVPLAERLCRAAADAGGLGRIGHVWGQVLRCGRAPDAAEVALAEAMTGPLAPADLVRLGVVRSVNLHFGLGDVPAAAAVLDAVDVPGLPDDLRDRLKVVRTTAEVQHRHVAVALASTFQPVAPHLTVYMRRNRALCLLHAGRYRDAEAEITACEQASAPAPHTGTLLMRCFSLAFGGRLAEADELASSLHSTLADEPRWTFTASALYSVLSHCARMRGHGTQAVRLAREGVPAPHEAPLFFDAVVLAGLACSAALTGDTTLAAAALARAGRARRPAWRITGTSVSRARSWVLAGAGDVRGAADAAMTAADECAELGLHSGEVMALHDAARFGVNTARRLTALTSTMDDPMTAAYAAHATALARASPTALEAVAADFLHVGATLYAAEALASAARLHRLRGNARAASQASARQALLMRGFDGARTPALSETGLTHLTRRQAEVARLATAGLTNQQIGERLHTSKRTVDNHLYAVYGVLGITGRGELRTVIGGR